MGNPTWKSSMGQAARFVIVGAVATAIHYVVYYVALGVAGHNMAYTAGYILSFVCNYVLSSRFTFRVPMSFGRLLGFAMSHVVNYLLGIMLLNLFIGLGISAVLAPLPVFAIVVPVNYLLVRYALTGRNRDDNSYRLFLLVAGFAMLWLQLLDAPTLSDDMIYRFMWQADEHAAVQTIDGLGDLLRSQWVHYQVMNGRFVVHFMGQLFLVFLPLWVLHVANALLFVALIHECACWVAGREQRLWAAVVACFLLFVVFQGVRTTLFWSIGTFNYLWVLVFTLALLHWLRGLGTWPRQDWNLFLSPLALVVGWGHEGLSLPLAAAFACWLVVHRAEAARRALTPYMVFYMLGTALCLLSPGIWGRSTDGVTLQTRLLSGVMSCLLNVRVAWLLLLALLLSWRRHRALVREHLRAHAYGYVAFSFSMAITLLCGTSLERVAFFTDFIAMLLLLPLLLQVMGRRWQRGLLLASALLLVACYLPAYEVKKENSETWHYAEQQMKQPGTELIAVDTPAEGGWLKQYFRSHYVFPSIEFGYFCIYMGFDAQDVNMRCAARLYGKERLVLLPADMLKRMETDSTAYAKPELDASGRLYAWRIADGEEVSAVRFVLNGEERSKLLPHQRLLAYDGDIFELDDFRFEQLSISGRKYLVFTRPTSNIYRRINHIEYKKKERSEE